MGLMCNAIEYMQHKSIVILTIYEIASIQTISINVVVLSVGESS